MKSRTLPLFVAGLLMLIICPFTVNGVFVASSAKEPESVKSSQVNTMAMGNTPMATPTGNSALGSASSNDLKTMGFLPLSTPSSLTKARQNSRERDRELEQNVLCKINQDRINRSYYQLLASQPMMKLAEAVGQRYDSGGMGPGDFDRLIDQYIASTYPYFRGTYTVVSSPSLDSNQGALDVEARAPTVLTSTDLQVFGIYRGNSDYTIITGSGVSSLPSRIPICPTYKDLYGNDTGVNVDLPSFLCAINRERTRAGLNSFVVHRALQDESKVQVQVMVEIGHYTVDGPRPVDVALHNNRVNVNKLWWMAGDSYSDANTLVNALMASYSSQVLDRDISVISVAQLNGFWSVILGGLPRSVKAGPACPATWDQISYTQ